MTTKRGRGGREIAIVLVLYFLSVSMLLALIRDWGSQSVVTLIFRLIGVPTLVYFAVRRWRSPATSRDASEGKLAARWATPATPVNVPAAAAGASRPAFEVPVVSSGGLWRGVFPALSLVVLLWSTPLLLRVPTLVRGAADIQNGRDLLEAGESDAAQSTFAAILRKHPDSMTAMTGQACAFAQEDETDGWAYSIQLALAAGMNPLAVQSCLRPSALATFVVLGTGLVPILRPADDPSIAGAEFVKLEDWSHGRAVMELADASCASGASGLPVLAIAHFSVAVNVGRALGLGYPIRERFEDCVPNWPESRARDLLEEWLSR